MPLPPGYKIDSPKPDAPNLPLGYKLDEGGDQIDYAKPVEPSNLQKLGTGAKEVLSGVGAGVISTGVGAYDLARKIPGADNVLPAPNEYVRGLTEPPDSTAGRAGKAIEQVGEFFIPSGLVSRGVKAIEGATTGMRGAKAIGALGKGALEAGSAAGVTGLQTGGNAGEVKKAALIGGAFGAFGKALEGAAPAVERSAEKGMNQALGATKETMKNASSRVVPELIKRRVWAFTRKGLLNRATGEAGEAGNRVEQGWNALPPDAKVRLSPILQALEKGKQEFVVAGTGAIGNPEAYNHLTEMQARIVQDLAPSLNGDISVASARSLRQILDKQVARAGGYFGKSLNDASLIAAKEAGANAIRREINSAYPDIAKLNAEFNLWRNVQNVLEETLKRTSSQNTPLTQQLGRVVGAVAGGHGIGSLAGAVVGDVITKAVGSPGWRMVSAANKARVADLLSSGKADQAAALVGKLVTSVNVDRSDRRNQVPQYAQGGVIVPNKRRRWYGPPPIKKQPAV